MLKLENGAVARLYYTKKDAAVEAAIRRAAGARVSIHRHECIEFNALAVYWYVA